MIITLSEPEIKRAVQYYVARKTGCEFRDCDVVLHLRARKAPYATVNVLKPVPTLTEKVQ